MKFWARGHKGIYRGEYISILAICDESALETLKKYEKFFKGELLSEEALKKEIFKNNVVFACGEVALDLLKSLGLTTGKNAKRLNGVPCIIIVFVKP